MNVLLRTTLVTLALCGSVAASPATADPAAAAPHAPEPYVAEYEVLRNGKPVGRGVVRLRQVDGTRWELSSITRGTGGLAGMAGLEIIETSRVHWIDGRPESLGYHFSQKAAWRTRERDVRIDAGAGRIVSRDRRGEHEFAFEAGVLDRQSVMLALAQDIGAGQGGTLRYTVVDRDEFGPQQYLVGKQESIEVPAGRIDTRVVTRLRAPGSGRHTTAWIGTEAPHVPVRTLQQEGDGDTIELRLAALRLGPVPAAPG